jgi:hypothetical protein
MTRTDIFTVIRHATTPGATTHGDAIATGSGPLSPLPKMRDQRSSWA